MILFHIYRHASEPWKSSWGAVTPVPHLLAQSFDRLLVGDTTLFSPQLFDDSRDSYRDLLNGLNSSLFPRFGPNLTAACAILEYTCPDPQLRLVIDVQPGCEQTAEDAHLRLPTYCGALHWLDNGDTILSLQAWMDLWFAHQNDKQAATTEYAVLTSTGGFVLADPPPIICLELGIAGQMAIVPSPTLVLPCQKERATYRLKGIIYSGAGHFTARLIEGNASWTYDGQVADGRPQMEGVSQSSVDLCKLEGRQAHICLYAS
jgi:hypothetical protein